LHEVEKNSVNIFFHSKCHSTKSKVQMNLGELLLTTNIYNLNRSFCMSFKKQNYMSYKRHFYIFLEQQSNSCVIQWGSR